MKNYFCLVLLFIFCNCSGERVLDSLLLSKDKLNFTWQGGIEDINVEANDFWIVSSTIPSWITINKTKGESGVSSISISVIENKTNEARTCYISFAIPEFNTKKILQITQTAKEYLAFTGENKEYNISSDETTLSLEITRNISYKLNISEESREWISQNSFEKKANEKTSNQATIKVSNIEYNINTTGLNKIQLFIAANKTKEERHAKVAIYNEIYNISDTIYITQEAGEEINKYQDGTYFLLQQAIVSNGVNLIVMGDGFTQQDMAQNGRYEMVMKQTADYFFSIEPFKSYRNYFNVYVLIAESEEAGVGNENIFKGTINNKFGTTFGDGTAITCNADLCFEYARKIKELSSDKPLTIIMSLNSTKYAGTTYLYANGNSIALCPMSEEASPNDFEGLIHHEAGGHGFGFLCDEYVYYKQKMPENRKKKLKEWQELGFQMNLDFTSDSSSILWKDFIGLDKYKQVGAYEGGYEYQYGVWRSEENSCMNNNIPYFNVQSRWSIVRRIMQLSGREISIGDFIENDYVVLPYITSRAIDDKSFKPLGEPIWIK